MSISELGSLGEFLASIAVFVTLVILILQFRSARAELSSQVTREIKRHNNEAFHQLTANPALMDLHIRGQRDYESLDETQKATWATWLFTWITQTEDGYIARRNGIPNMEWIDAYMLGVAAVLRSPGGATLWPKTNHYYDQGFVKAIDALVAEDDTTWLGMLLD